MEKKLPISVLLFDDKSDYCKTLKLRASSENIIITDRQSWDTAYEELVENHPKYQFVILDAKSFLKEGQAEGSENINSVVRAITDIKDLQGKVKHPIPFCINTGYTEFRGMFEDTTRVFEKGAETEELFNYIKSEVDKLPETQIRNDYYEIFQVFEYGYLERALEIELINIIKRSQRINETTNKSVLRDMRPFLEAIFSNPQLKKLYPAKLKRDNGIDLGSAIKFIAGSWGPNPITKEYEFSSDQLMPLHVFYIARSLKDATSDIGMHYSQERISKYLVLSQFNALLEIILWFKSFMDKNS